MVSMCIFHIEITTHPSNTTVIALQDVTLTCSASVDDVTYTWHRDGGSLPSRSRGRNSNTLTITRATPPDEGMYYCMANTEEISVKSTIARVRVDGEKSSLLTRTVSYHSFLNSGGCILAILLICILCFDVNFTSMILMLF